MLVNIINNFDAFDGGFALFNILILSGIINLVKTGRGGNGI